MIETRAVDLSPAGLERSAAMLREAMPYAAHMTADVLEWQYVTNPVGHALGLEAWEGDRLVSHCVAQPLTARLLGREVRGLMSMNAATLPDCLGRGIYFGLAAELYRSAPSNGFQFGVAVTNDASTAGFERHCGFHRIRPLEARLGIGPVRLNERESEVDFEKTWSDDSTRWRLSPPHTRYRYQPHGSVARVLAPTGRFGIEATLGQVAAASVPTDRPPVKRSANPLRLWVGLDERIDWHRSAYVPLPMRIRPSPLNLIFADLTDRGIDLDPHRVRWTGLDFDDF